MVSSTYLWIWTMSTLCPPPLAKCAERIPVCQTPKYSLFLTLTTLKVSSVPSLHASETLSGVSHFENRRMYVRKGDLTWERMGFIATAMWAEFLKVNYVSIVMKESQLHCTSEVALCFLCKIIHNVYNVMLNL